MEKYEAFLNELTKLTQKYGVEISGCGCCGSPALTEVKAAIENVSPWLSPEYSSCERLFQYGDPGVLIEDVAGA